MKKVRPDKKELKEFEKTFEEIPTKEELKKEDTLFQKQLRKLKSMIQPKKLSSQAKKAKKEALKYKPKGKTKK